MGNGQMWKRTNGKTAKCGNGQMGNRTNGETDKCRNGKMGKRENMETDKWGNGQFGKTLIEKKNEHVKKVNYQNEKLGKLEGEKKEIV